MKNKNNKASQRNAKTNHQQTLLMKYIATTTGLYPVNDRTFFTKVVQPNGEHWLFLNYTDRREDDIKIGDATNYKHLSFEDQIKNTLIDRVKELHF